MLKKAITTLFLFFVLPSFAQDIFKAGVSFDFTKEETILIREFTQNAPELKRSFVDLNYSIDYKPLSLLGENDYVNKNAARFIAPEYVSAPSSYNLSLDSSKNQSSSELAALVRKHPDDTNLLFAYAIQLKKEGRLDEALSIAEKAIKADPDFVLGHFLKGDILRKMGNLKEACYEYIYTAQINPYCSDAYYNVARILEILNDRELALDYYRLAYQINPKDEEIRDIILDDYMDL